VQSGIPTGAQLAETWLREIYDRDQGQRHPTDSQLETWLKTDPLRQVSNLTLENAPEHYSYIFEERFDLRGNRKSRAFGNNSRRAEQALNKLMEGREPSFGYSLLARLVGEFLDGESDFLAGQMVDCDERESNAEMARQAATVLPSIEVLDKIMRYETKLERQMYRAMNQLERLQRRRLGEVVPPPLSMVL
jgi:hypothetical protein